MKTKVTYPKTDQPVRVERKYWSLSTETQYNTVLITTDYLSSPDKKLVDFWIRDARNAYPGYGFRRVWLNEIQVLTNGDVWIQKKLQATIVEDD